MGRRTAAPDQAGASPSRRADQLMLTTFLMVTDCTSRHLSVGWRKFNHCRMAQRCLRLSEV
jgi:hypothetical protein